MIEGFQIGFFQQIVALEPQPIQAREIRRESVFVLLNLDSFRAFHNTVDQIARL
jgi:hypothetical protein